MVWVGDFLSDPNVAAMDTTDVGAFWLLCLYAAQSNGKLPNDDAVLSRLTRLGDAWPEHRERVLKAWVVTPSVITQKRLVQEVRNAEERQAAARKAAATRWDKSRRSNEEDAARSASALPRGSGSGSGDPTASPASAGEAPERSPTENQNAARDLLGGLVGEMAMPRGPRASVMTKPAWDWLKLNATPSDSDDAMAFVGWLIKTGTRDPEMLLALVKDRVVHKPDNPHAYYTPKGLARQNIVTRVAADRAIAEHERIKREERAFLNGGR